MSSRSILLVTHQPELMHSSILQAEGYQVDTAQNFPEAKRLWGPGKYGLVLITTNGDASKALEFCEELKEADASQLIAFLSGWQAYFPQESCPDQVISREEGPINLVRQVADLIGPSTSN